MLQRHYFCHDLNRAFPSEALARSDEMCIRDRPQTDDPVSYTPLDVYKRQAADR
nr:hypothetical protein [Pseudomonas sp. HS-2]